LHEVELSIAKDAKHWNAAKQ